MHGLTVEFEEAGAVVVRFPTRNVTCRWMPGGGLAGMVCSCHSPEACEHKVAAVLAFQVASGLRTLDDVEPAAREASAGAPRTRAEVLDSVSDVGAEAGLTRHHAVIAGDRRAAAHPGRLGARGSTAAPRADVAGDGR